MKRFLTAALVLPLIAACDDGVGPDDAILECVTNVTAEQGDTFVELCALDAPVRHVRIDNFRAPATHASAQLVFGFDAPPASSTAELAADQFRVLFYGGGAPFQPPVAQASFGDIDVSLGDAAFVNAGATVCFDVHDGSATTAPTFILWVDGVKGADCDSRATLTAASAYSAVAEWGGTVGAIDKAAKSYFRQSAAGGTTPTVRLSAEPVLGEAQIRAALACSTSWSANTDWQQLCTPAVGTVSHIRIEAARSTANNTYFYAVFGQDASPIGNPVPGAGKLIVTGGRSHLGTSWTWFRFGAGTTTQFSYATDAGSALYTDDPTTICFDIGSGTDGNARFTYWATGAGGADCEDVASLTAENALYDSTTDPVTAAIWGEALAADKLNFIKTNNTSASVGEITVFAESALP